VVRFLISCEDEGFELVQFPPYVREWILREHAEGVMGKRITEPSLRYDIGRRYNSATPGLPRFRLAGWSGCQ